MSPIERMTTRLRSRGDHWAAGIEWDVFAVVGEYFLLHSSSLAGYCHVSDGHIYEAQSSLMAIRPSDAYPLWIVQNGRWVSWPIAGCPRPSWVLGEHSYGEMGWLVYVPPIEVNHA